jgi:hypothetical protein
MQRHYDELARYQREGFTVIVDKTWEDLSLDQCFDTSIDPDTGRPYYDVEKMAQQIDQGDLDWFMLRVRVLLDGHEFGSHYLGGCLYEWNRVKDVLTDGTAEDGIYSALEEARTEVRRLRERLNAIAVE